ncbi:MAG: protein-L-isoaspartate(D-aspartate) O-methyltransferase [Pirellulaceae bacterium]|nr:protein-L-isoaspartate(D-aspartate) O-methyltransferase [Pirellulaceae bacterium]
MLLPSWRNGRTQPCGTCLNALPLRKCRARGAARWWSSSWRPATFGTGASWYLDGPLPIGQGQTISQPYIVGLMTQLARPHAEAIALDIGTGSGYQAAVLSLLCRHVYSMEIVESLADAARERLARLGYTNVTVRVGDGYAGWEEHAPFDLIIVAAAPERIPQPLIDQLKPAGRLVIPVGKFSQDLIVVHKQPDGSVRRESVIPVAFVPMTGQAQR